MEKELLNSDKELLLKDLCSRLPYKVKCNHESYSEVYTLYAIDYEHLAVNISPNNSEYDNSWWNSIEQVKPYLFPLSSMKGKHRAELFNIRTPIEDPFQDSLCEIDFYHRCHFDYRDLIGKGLAIDATGLNIY